MQTSRVPALFMAGAQRRMKPGISAAETCAMGAQMAMPAVSEPCDGDMRWVGCAAYIVLDALIEVVVVGGAEYAEV